VNAMFSTSREGTRPIILVVEDEVLVRTTLASMLDEAGFRVIPAANADEALEVLAAVPRIAMIITDVALPSSSHSGFELAEKIRATWPIRVLVASGRTAPSEAEVLLGIHFVAKPIHPQTLVHLIRVMMDKGLADDLTSTSDLSGPKDEANWLPTTNTTPEPSGLARDLTPRQRQVLELLVEGRSNRDIARALSLSENTVKAHLAAIFRVLGVQTRTAAAAGARLLQSA
jgi:DNA-binding NarL/FixJ family response regulator